MQLAHPVSGQALHVQAGLAEDFAEVIGRLGWSEVLLVQPYCKAHPTL